MCDASEKAGKPVAVLQDLQGPKIRLGNIDGTADVKEGEEWILVYGQSSDVSAKRLEVQYDLSLKMKPDEPIFLFDGKVAAHITAVDKRRRQSL